MPERPAPIDAFDLALLFHVCRSRCRARVPELLALHDFVLMAVDPLPRSVLADAAAHEVTQPIDRCE